MDDRERGFGRGGGRRVQGGGVERPSDGRRTGEGAGGSSGREPTAAGFPSPSVFGNFFYL